MVSFLKNNSVPKRVIVFKEKGQERVFPAKDDEELAASCLIILRERFSNPAWGYKPQIQELSEEEQDFLDFWQRENTNFLPTLLYKQGQRIYDRLEERLKDDTDPDWVWYKALKELLSINPDAAKAYKVSFHGKFIPTAYYLLSKRRYNTHEDFYILETS